MGTLRIRHTIETDPATFFDTLLYGEDFNRRLYLDELGFRDWRVVSDSEQGDERVREVYTVPQGDAPAPIRKLIGDSIAYTERSRFNRNTGRYQFEITTSKFADKIDIRGEMWVEPVGESQIERVCEITVDVRMFGVGKLVESFIEKSIQESYDRAAALSNRYVADSKLA